MTTQVFLATPITALLGDDGTMPIQSRQSIQTIIGSLREELGLEVFCAIEREAWGHKLMSGIECTSLDLDAMKGSDVVLAFTGASHGVHMELGWASAMALPVFACVNIHVGIKSPLVEGLGTITNAQLMRYSSDHSLPSPPLWREKILPNFADFVGMFPRHRKSSHVRRPLSCLAAEV